METGLLFFHSAICSLCDIEQRIFVIRWDDTQLMALAEELCAKDGGAKTIQTKPKRKKKITGGRKKVHE